MPKRNKVVRVLHIGLYPYEANIISKLEDDGVGLTETLRQVIREYGERRYPTMPTYAEAQKLHAELRKKKLELEVNTVKMTEAEYALKVLRGKIIGDQVEFRAANGKPIFVPLRSIKEYSVDKHDFIKFHNQLLERTFEYVNGQVPTDEDYEYIWRGWGEEEGVE